MILIRTVAAAEAVAAQAAVAWHVGVCTLPTLIDVCEGGTQTLQVQHLQPAQQIRQALPAQAEVIIERQMRFSVCLIIHIFSKKDIQVFSH